jgi:hypothetical protein
MSWDISLVDDRGHIEGDWNYTHNCNGMIEDAVGDAGLAHSLGSERIVPHMPT